MGEDGTGEAGLRIHQTIARRIAIDILSGRIAPGARIGNEIDEAIALGVSRTAYREAIRILVAKGLPASRPKAGTHVTREDRWNLFDPEVLEWMFAGQPDREFVRDLFELRGIIEPAAASLAARLRTAEHLTGLHQALADMRLHGLATLEGQSADQTFHRLLLSASGNRALLSLASSITAAVHWTTHFKQRQSATPRDPIPDHQTVLDAIERQDEGAAAAAMRHLLELAFADMRPALA